MKQIVLFGFVIICLTFSAFAEEQEVERYSDRYDHLNVEEVLYNARLRNQYYNCIMDTGPCVTDVAKMLKELLPEAVVTKCQKCTQKQKEAFDQIVVWYSENEPEHLDAMARKIVGDFQAKAAAKKERESKSQ